MKERMKLLLMTTIVLIVSKIKGESKQIIIKYFRQSGSDDGANIVFQIAKIRHG